MPDRSAWGRCHYDDETKASHYDPQLEIEYAECKPGYFCELLMQDFAMCMPDPKADHECCVSWNNKCEKEGDCCLGSECNSAGYCEVGLLEVSENPGFCDHSRDTKEDRKLFSRCYDWESGGQGDCANGYLCLGNHMYAQCEIDPSVKNDYCKWEFDSSNPRPGDCCEGWMSHCNQYDPYSGTKCIASQCIPGRETGVDQNGNSMLDVHDRLQWDPPAEASYNEKVHECIGAVCGVWGDPHIVTCDDLHYDCQAVGLFTLMQNHMFNIQGNFVHIDTPWDGASITNDIAIEYVKDDSVPTMQFSFPDFSSVDPSNPVYPAESRKIGACPVMFYLGGELVDISAIGPNGYLLGDVNSDYSAKLTGYNQIDIKHLAGVNDIGEKYYSNSVVWIEGSGPFTEWSCIITFFVCLPREEQTAFENYSVGLLGTPNGKIADDWMAPSGQTLVLPDHDRESESFTYCYENWCVAEEDSIMAYEEGFTYEDYECKSNQEYHEFDINGCGDQTTIDAIIKECESSPEPRTCQMEKCIGNPEVNEEIEVIMNITRSDINDNFVEFPDAEPPDYGDCANLGSGLSGSTGSGAYSLAYPNIGSILSTGSFSIGYDHSVSVLVGGDFTCKQGAGFEGRSVFLGDMTLEQAGCERLAATTHGSLIHPPENSVCVEVGGAVSIESDFNHKKFIMYEYGNDSKDCHVVYKNECTMNGATCPHALADLESNFVYTNGDFKQEPSLDLTRWEDEITLLQQKTAYWQSLEANGVTVVTDGVLTFSSSRDNDPVQIFKISPIDEGIVSVVFNKDMHGKTILIIVEGDGEFFVPPMCYHPRDALPNDAAICGTNSFPTALTGSIAWLFPTEGSVTMHGNDEFQGSIVFPWGSLIANMIGHSGRMIVGGDLTLDGPFTELHNYEYDPQNHPLPLGEELDEMCEVQEPPCVESHKTMTSDTVCPTAPEGVAKLIHSSAPLPEGEPILYGFIIEEPADPDSAHTVKFQVDNPWTDHADIYVKHVKKVGKYAMDPVCDAMPFTAGCAMDAPVIEIGCHEYDGVAPFALVNIYFASNTDSEIILAGNDVEVDKCCKPPAEYDAGYGIIEVTYEIQCTCPPTAVS